MFSKELRKDWKSLYFILKDSKLLVYDPIDHSDLITEPKTVLFMGPEITVIKQHEESENPDDPTDNTLVRFYFSAINMQNENESIAMCAFSEAERDRWISALNMASLVSTRNVMIASLDKENISIRADVNPAGMFNIRVTSPPFLLIIHSNYLKPQQSLIFKD